MSGQPRVALVALVALACGASTPSTIGECSALSSATERETCRYTMLKPTVAGSRIDGDTLDQGLVEISDETSRDLVLLRLAIAAPRHAAELCRRVHTAGAEEKCQQVLGRPHLGTQRRAPQSPPDGAPQ